MFENNITKVDLNKLIDFIQNCLDNDKFNNLITFTKNYDFWEDFNNALRKFKYGAIYENIMYIDINKCKFYPNLIGLIDLQKYTNEMNCFVQLFNSLNKETSASKVRRKKFYF